MKCLTDITGRPKHPARQGNAITASMPCHMTHFWFLGLMMKFENV